MRHRLRCGNNVCYLPAEHGIRARAHLLDHGHPQHRPVSVEDYGKRQLLGYKRQAECVAIELSGSIRIGRGHESNHSLVAQSKISVHGLTLLPGIEYTECQPEIARIA